MFKKYIGKIMGMVFAAGAALSTLSASAAGDVHGVAMAVSSSGFFKVVFPVLVVVVFCVNLWGRVQEIRTRVEVSRVAGQQSDRQREIMRQLAEQLREQQAQAIMQQQMFDEQQRQMQQQMFDEQQRQMQQQMFDEQQRQFQQQVLDEQQRQFDDFSMMNVTPIEQGGFVDTTFSAGGTFGF